jgi:DNA topoisomerase-1
MTIDPVGEAKSAGLHYVSDARPGIRRERFRGKFRYVKPDGSTIRDESERNRIGHLAIPPAYEDVWISPDPLGHIQATGRDARGRKQYRYHERWRVVRDAAKYDRLLDFAEVLPAVRKALEHDLARTGMPKEKVLAGVVTLLETTLIRVGNEEYARSNQSFGLTTLRNRHARVRGANLRFEFKGKSGLQHRVDLHDRRLSRLVARCQELPGQHLFSFLDDDGTAVPIDSADVNAYIREIAGADFTAKDFRTWLGTVYCAHWLLEHPAQTEAERSKNAVEAVKSTALQLRNTPAVCRKCYIHPAVLERYLESGRLAPHKGRRASQLRPEERFAVDLLRYTASPGGHPERKSRRRKDQ